MTVTVVAQHIVHDVGDLLLQFVYKHGGIIFLMLDVTQLFLPDARQLTALEQLLVNGVDKLYARGGGHKVLAFSTYVTTLEQGLYYSGTRRRPADAVLLKGSTQRLVLNKLTCRLHGAQERGFGIIFWRRGLLLRKRGRVRAALTLYKRGQRALLITFLAVFFVGVGF